MKKIYLIIALLLVSINVYAAELNLDCPDSTKVNEKIDCKVKVSSIEEVEEVSFQVSGSFDINVIPAWSHVESGGVHTFTRESNESLTIATISLTPKSVGDGSIKLENISGVDAGTTQKTIKVIDNKSSNNYLSNITIDGEKVPNFDKEKSDYKVTVYKNKVTIEAKPEDDKAQVNVPGETNLSIGEQTYTISVTSEDGQERNYRLTIKYEVPKNADNSLKTLELYNGSSKIKELDYKKGVQTYEGIKVKSDVATLTIKATVNDEKAKFVEDYGPREVELDYGENIFYVRVEAENGDIASYTIKVLREDGRNTDATLSQLKVNGIQVELQKDVYEYEVKVRYNEQKSRIETVATNNSSKVEFEDIELVDGMNEPVIITVTSESNKTQIYKVRIFRLSEQESKIVLEKVEVVNYKIDFSVDKKEYDIKLRDGDDHLEFVVFPSELQSKIDPLGNKDLKNNSTVILKVTDDDGTKRYTFNIIKDEEEGPSIILYIIIFAILLLITIFLIIFISKKKKKNKEKENVKETVEEKKEIKKEVPKTVVSSDDDVPEITTIISDEPLVKKKENTEE